MHTLLALNRIYKTNRYHCITSIIVSALFYTAACTAQTIRAVYITHHMAIQVNHYENDSLVKSYTDKLNIPNSEHTYTYSNQRSVYILTKSPAHFSRAMTDRHTGQTTPHLTDYPTAETFFKDLELGSMHITQTTRGADENYNGELMAFNWKITPETQTIAQHKCRKATDTFNGTLITAWYATDIAVKDGPSRFRGLPGLILKVRIGDYLETTASQILMSPGTTEIIPPEATGKTQQ